MLNLGFINLKKGKKAKTSAIKIPCALPVQRGVVPTKTIISHVLWMLFVVFGLSSYLKHTSAQPTAINSLNKGESLPYDTFIKMAKIINPVVVNISTTQMLRSSLQFPQIKDPFFDFFFNPRGPSRAEPLRSLGTGFIIRSNGLILTNTHVVNRADTIQVQLKDNPKLYKAKIIGQDVYTDIALIKIHAEKPLPIARLGNSSALRVGEWVAAFGNPYGHGHTMTKGIISAINRRIDELNLFPFLQTDAIINPGNSGGPLVNTQAEVIGINTAMRTQGISFAIPIDNVKVVLKDLESHGRVRRGFIGVHMATYSAQDKGTQKGALILEVLPNTPADQAGIQKQDIITKFNHLKIRGYKDLFQAVARTPVNKTVPVALIRQGKAHNLTITVAERTAPSAKTKAPVQPSYESGRKAPFNLGLVMVTGTKKAMSALGLPPLNRPHPVVAEVRAGSPAAFAGFRAKDIILKVNGGYVQSARDVQRRLSRNRTNTLNVLRYRAYSRQYVNMVFQLRAR